ncbi:hypothetical protein CY35_01G193000 [Sphagnum magellanicum]|jgi:aspartate carbamoyltransferase catalytic subunit|nr:hypothetical protein CY35_01G193000 [Sphagnum magellanicum]
MAYYSVAASSSFSPACVVLSAALVVKESCLSSSFVQTGSRQLENGLLPLSVKEFSSSSTRRNWISRNSAKQRDDILVASADTVSTERGKFPLQHILEAQQFDTQLLNSIFQVAREMEEVERNSEGSQVLKGYLMATLFYEPSTRTRLSFESAMKRLGGEVLTTENAREFSSAAKGETLEDTMRTVEGYSDIIVLRHFESGAARKAAAVSNIPVINAGDGPGQHPTQALLDMYTIQREIGHLDNIKVGLVGDLANGRTVRSLAYLLAKYTGVQIYFVAPDVVKMKDDIKQYLTSRNVHWEESSDLLEVAANCDVVYQTRIQRERFGDRVDLYNEARGKYIVDTKVMSMLPEHGVILHPLPRLDEITVEVDSDPRAAYFRQAKNGLYIRMALLKLLLQGY